MLGYDTNYLLVIPFVSCSPSTWLRCMTDCFMKIENCDAIVMLVGVEKSKGANTELLTMLLFDKPVVTLNDFLKASILHEKSRGIE